MRIIAIILILLALIAAAFSLYVRTASVDADQWHVDPDEVTAPTSPNFALLAGSQATTIDAPALAVAGRLQETAEAEGGQVIAGSFAEGFVTVMIRSRVFGFPDFVTVKLEPEGEQTRMSIFSRARFGSSDLGVNTARAQRWLTAARGA